MQKTEEEKEFLQSLGIEEKEYSNEGQSVYDENDLEENSNQNNTDSEENSN